MEDNKSIWVVTQPQEISGVVFSIGDMLEGNISTINSNGVEGLWIKYSKGKKIAVPLYALAKQDSPEGQAALKTGKSLLQMISKVPLWGKSLPALGLFAGLGVAKIKGGGAGRYFGYGILFMALGTIPGIYWMYKNMQGANSVMNKMLKDKVLGTNSRTSPSDEKFEQYANELTSSLADFMKANTGIAPDPNDMRAVAHLMKQAELDEAEFILLHEYILASVELKRRELSEIETDETLKPVFDKIDELTKEISKNQKIAGIVKILNGTAI